MNDHLTVPARDGIEAQRGHNDIFPGDPYPVHDQLKRGLDALRAQASGRGRITSLEIFSLTDPLMDILARVTRPSPPDPMREEIVRVLGQVVSALDGRVHSRDALKAVCDAADLLAKLREPANG